MIQLKIVTVPTIKVPIAPSPGFRKKKLSDFKLDLSGLCAYGCRYCSSNYGNYLRIRRGEFADLTEQQTGKRTLPAEDPHLMFAWREIISRIEEQLARRSKEWGEALTLVFSMLTDGFSPPLVKDGTTETALRLILEKTSFRIRVLTKNSIVGSSKWIRFFQSYPGRFVVGLSVGSIDDGWARRVEVNTPPPSSRLRALRRLQDAGVPTYGMLCPMFPQVLQGNHLERLVDAVRPHLCEDVWAEPYNDRVNWRHVRDVYPQDSPGYDWLTDIYEHRQMNLWSNYAAELYRRLRNKAAQEGWLSKLHYLLYEGDIASDDAKAFTGLRGVLLQSKPGDDGKSRNPYFAALQHG